MIVLTGRAGRGTAQMEHRSYLQFPNGRLEEPHRTARPEQDLPTGPAPPPVLPAFGHPDFDDDESVLAEFAAALLGVPDSAAPKSSTARVRYGRGPQRMATKALVSLRLSRHVLAHFRRTGPGWQRRIDEVLRYYVAVRGRNERLRALISAEELVELRRRATRAGDEAEAPGRTDADPPGHESVVSAAVSAAVPAPAAAGPDGVSPGPSAAAR